MKKFTLLISLSLVLIQTSGQEIDFNLSYSNSTLRKFKNAIGFDIGFSKITKKENKIGLLVCSSFNSFNYDWIRIDLSDPRQYIIMDIKPDSYSLSLQGYYCFHLYKNDNAAVFLGPMINLNYFKIYESIHQLPSGTRTEIYYNDNDWFYNKIGIGLLLEYEIRKVIKDDLDLTYSLNPMIGSFEHFPAMGSTDPWFYLSINFKIGLSYRFGIKQK